MKNAVILGLIFLIIGLIVGYIVFGKIGGEYISVTRIFGFKKGFGNEILNTIMGIEKIRNNIILFGAGGFAVGFLLGILFKKR